jgi:hypothetical protein
VGPPSKEEVVANSIPLDEFNDPYRKGNEMLGLLRQERVLSMDVPYNKFLASLGVYASTLSPHESSEMRSILLYMELKRLMSKKTSEDPTTSSVNARSAGGSQSHRPEQPLSGASGPLGDPVVRQPTSEPEEILSGPDDEMDDGSDALSFLKTTPFERKPASEVLGGLSDDLVAANAAAAKDQPPEDAALYADPIESMLLMGRTANLDDDMSIKGKALSLLVGAPSDLADPETGLSLVPKDDWIGAAIQDASKMVATPRSSDSTVVGFNDQTITKVMALEVLMDSPSPSQAVKSFERVVAAKVTPKTIPEQQSMDATADELDSFFSQIAGNKQPT